MVNIWNDSSFIDTYVYSFIEKYNSLDLIKQSENWK